MYTRAVSTFPLPPSLAGLVAPAERPVASPGKLAATIIDAHAPSSQTTRPAHVAEVALVGLPDDTGVSLNNGRPGAREGPRAFRAALSRLGVAEPGWMDPSSGGAVGGTGAHPRAMPSIVDIGDVRPGATLNETHDRVTRVVEGVLDAGLFPVAIGGGHDLTFPFARAAASRSRVRAGLYCDAHLDVRAEPGSGMAFRSLIEQCAIARLAIVGYQPLVNARHHAEYFVSRGGRVTSPATNPGDAQRQIESLLSVGDSAFVSLDLDAIDAAHAPGVSAMNPEGLSVATLGAYALAAGRSTRVACLDIMELNPSHDPDGRTARVAAWLFLRFCEGFSQRGWRAGPADPATP